MKKNLIVFWVFIVKLYWILDFKKIPLNTISLVNYFNQTQNLVLNTLNFVSKFQTHITNLNYITHLCRMTTVIIIKGKNTIKWIILIFNTCSFSTKFFMSYELLIISYYYFLVFLTFKTFCYSLRLDISMSFFLISLKNKNRLF